MTNIWGEEVSGSESDRGAPMTLRILEPWGHSKGTVSAAQGAGRECYKECEG